MRILLVGEFSRLHNSLKEGLMALGHEVLLISNGDGFKNYPADISTNARFFKSKVGNVIRQIWFRIFKFDLALLEHGIRFWCNLPKLKNYDVVQLINEKPIQTHSKLEYYLIKKLFKQNKTVFLLCSGVDYVTLNYMLQKKERYSILNAYFEDIKQAKKQYDFMFEYLTKTHQKIHTFLYEKIKGVIASDLDYVNPLIANNIFLGMIPNPVNLNKIQYQPIAIQDKISIFLGINSGNSYTKGIHYFEEALQIIQKKYPEKVTITVTTDVPYSTYISFFDNAHIVLDQVFAFDQGYNALEAMAKGKVVFTGAEKEFLDYYNLQNDEVAINALPDVLYLVEKLSFLIENPNKILEIGNNARNFIEREHNHIHSAKKYLTTWNLQKTV